ncbi:hypothetical protein C1646_776454 [Rhizophagus diaphanus]|nr:hypothetical protein C1646_776454 [Rhizophagus diaphanus] [Rhizophagus sp. MUCL 43196]
MQRIPVEVAERIIANFSDEDLFIGSSVYRVWWQIVRQEAYKRWKEYAYKIGDIYREIQAMDLFTIDQIRIMEDMLKNGMIVDSQEEEIIRHAISENNWGWKFEWEWNDNDTCRMHA